ncbi:MAG TPA: hypothetical protein DCS93_14070 [Microscillaceae bacterium]|nr:hypothetical protein [Microscillaceae bacterium]
MKIKKIRTKLLLNFLGVGIVPLLFLSYLGFWFAEDLLKDKNFEQLNAIRESKRQTIEEYFQLVRNEIQYLSENQTIINAMQEFKAAFHSPTSLTLTEADKAKLNEFYENRIFRQLGNSIKNIPRNRLIPQDSIGMFFQRHYLKNIPSERKGHPYHEVHDRYHLDIKEFLNKFKYYDILLIDNETGHIIYSVDKEIDFATSLKTGQFAQTNIAKVYQEVKQAREPGFVKTYDFEQYAPSGMKPSMFIGAPIFDGKKNIGSLIFELSTAQIDYTMTNNRKWKQIGLGETGESFILGREGKMRSDARAFLEDPTTFFARLEQSKTDARDLANMKQFRSSILFYTIENEATKDAALQRAGTKLIKNQQGKEMLVSYAPLRLPDLDWYLMTQVNEAEVMAPLNKLKAKVYTGILILLLAIVGTTLFLSRNLSKPIKNLQKATEKIKEGSFDEEIKVHSYDEIGKLAQSFNQMAHTIREKNTKLNLEHQKLESSKQELEARQWLSNGVIEFLPLLQRTDNDIKAMTDDILTHLTRYANAVQSAIYEAKETNASEGEKKVYLELLAHRAHNKKFRTEEKIQLGEGLVGTCAKNKEILQLTPKEEEYDIISSATFQAKPSTLLLVPLLNNQRLVGVLEITFLRKISENDLAFIERISERVGLAMFNMKADLLMQNLLQEVQAQNAKLSEKEEILRKNSEELKNLNDSLEERVEAATQDIQEKNQRLLTQEEELRQNLEELNALNESLDLKVEERTKELREKEIVLQQNLDSLKASQLEQHKLMLMLENSDNFVILTSIEGQVMYLNKAARAMQALGPEDAIEHLSLMDFKAVDNNIDLASEIMPIVAQRGFWKGELKQMHEGEGMLMDVEASIFPVIDVDTQEWICFAMIQRDITEQKAAQNKLIQQEEELRQNAEELQTLNESLEQRIDEATQDIQQKNQRLLAHEEELRQNIEELNTLNESLDEKVAERTQELVDKERLLEKKLSELREAQIEQQKLAAMVDNSDDMITMMGFDGKAVYMNRQAKKIWGIDEDVDITQLIIDDFDIKNTKGEDVNLYSEIFPTVVEQGFWMGEFIQSTPQETRPIHVDTKMFTVIDETTQEPVCIAAIQRDITGRKKAEDRIRRALAESKRSREMIQAVIDATPDWIFVKDRNYKYILCNRSFARAFNRTKKQVIGEDDYTLGFAKEIIEGNEEKGLRGFREDDRRVLQYEHFIHNTNDPGIQINGDLRYFDTQKLPLFDSTGGVYAVLAIARDFTDRKIFEDKLKTYNREVTQQQQNIQASINYAKRIQNALLPKKSHIEESFPNSFILFKPRDIVSGDFYWFGKVESKPIYEEVSSFEGVEKVFKGFTNEKILISAVDCTGHGVPGAFMSLIGNDVLNEVVTQHEITDPDKVLLELHKGVRKMLKQRENDMQDGMDMALCTFDLEERILEFAGAKNPLVYIQDGQLHEIKGSKHPIGGRDQRANRAYQKHTIDISKPTTVYIYTDGYQDQFGGKEGRKFMKKRLRQLFLQIHQKPMQEQKQILAETFQQWITDGGERQIDDVLVIGIQV